MTYLAQNVSGRGVNFATHSSVFIAANATVVGGCYMLAEDGDAPDVTGVTVANGGGTDGTRANILTIPASVSEALGEATPVLPTYVVATEVAAAGAPVRCIIEGYYIDGLVFNNSTQLEPRRPLVATNTVGDFRVWAATLAGPLANHTPIHARLLKRMSSSAVSGLAKIHFRGFPGGFGIGAGGS